MDGADLEDGQPRWDAGPGEASRADPPTDPLSTLRGERGGRDRAERWVGRRFEYVRLRSPRDPSGSAAI